MRRRDHDDLSARTGRSRPVAALGLAMTALLCGACALGPESIPVPGASVPGPTYQVRIELAHALNLPARAKVVANGVKIGSLRSVAVIDPTATAPGRVDAVVEISTSVSLPVDSTAQLRQNTVLGDIYIGITTPAAGFENPIAPGGVIPLAQTKPALQVEDLLSGLATFTGGGALHEIQAIIDQTNAVLPARPEETARIFDTVGGDVEDIAANLDSVDRFLAAVEANIAVAQDNVPELDALLSERGSTEIPADARSLVLTLGIVGNLGIIGHAVEWLGPLLQQGDAAAKALVPLLFADQPLDLTEPSNLHRLVTLLRDTVVPFAERGPKLNITTVRGDDAVSTDNQVDAMVRALRMIGMVR